MKIQFVIVVAVLIASGPPAVGQAEPNPSASTATVDEQNLLHPRLEIGSTSQPEHLNGWPRLIFKGELGSEAALGYELPSTAVGPAIEIPIGKGWEAQARALYSPDRKTVTHNGQSLQLEGSAVRFVKQRIGIVGTVNRTWLWTSEFDKTSLKPSAGIVWRDDYLARLYLTYVFPTGCVWATADNPCTIQSNRVQGLQFRQEFRVKSHLRWGFHGGVYHFCDQANPNESQTGRSCHIGVTALADIGYEFHFARESRTPATGQSSNFATR